MNVVIDAPVGREHPLAAANAATLTPEELETLIDHWHRLGISETDRELQRLAFKRMTKLISMRTPERVREMERAKGLR